MEWRRIDEWIDEVKSALGRNPVVALLGARQVGKTTLARELADGTASHYFDLEYPVVAAAMEVPNTARSLEQTYMIRKLLPWHANVGERLVKSPKIYFRDSGIFHALQGVVSTADLLTHPKLGASWEGFALEQALAALRPFDAYFDAVHGGAELDLFLPTAGRRLGIEFKRQDAPKITRSMRVAREDLQMDELWIVYPGVREVPLEPGISLKPLASFCTTGRRQI